MLLPAFLLAGEVGPVRFLCLVRYVNFSYVYIPVACGSTFRVLYANTGSGSPRLRRPYLVPCLLCRGPGSVIGGECEVSG